MPLSSPILPGRTWGVAATVRAWRGCRLCERAWGSCSDCDAPVIHCDALASSSRRCRRISSYQRGRFGQNSSAEHFHRTSGRTLDRTFGQNTWQNISQNTWQNIWAEHSGKENKSTGPTEAGRTGPRLAAEHGLLECNGPNTKVTQPAMSFHFG